MKGLLIVVALCAVYSVQAWNENFGPLHIETNTGELGEKYYPLSVTDKQATRKATSFVNFIKIIPQVNPLRLPSLGPYNVALPDVNFQGDLRLSNVVVNGIKSVSLTGLELRLSRSRLDFNISIPQVSAEVNFELHGSLPNIPVDVNGQVSATISTLVVSGAVSPILQSVGDIQVYQVNDADVTIDLNELQLSLDMNQYTEDFRQIIIHFLNNIQEFSSVVNDLLRAVLKAVNNELTRITAKEILQYLTGKKAVAA